MNREMRPVNFAILDHDACRWGASIDDDTALTLVAVTSEDPACWEDMVTCWPRYRTPVVSEFAGSLPLEPVDFATARRAFQECGSWVFIDLIQRCIITGPEFQPIERHAAFSMIQDANGNQRWPLSIHLPPWWELHAQADANAIERERETPLVIPHTDREFLYGPALLNDLASRMLDLVRSYSWKSSHAVEDLRQRHKFTIQVHCNWLMTPRSDLDGRFPRQLLHGGLDWIDRLTWAQQLRYGDCGEIVALSTDISNYETAPMGREEMATYFDLCRELINEGWQWCIEHRVDTMREDRGERQRRLVEHLTKVREAWLSSPFEGGSPPRFIIECSRRRVPRGAGVTIVGMDEQEAPEHIIDCDCPLCIMMAEGKMGVGFIGIDGHHLELDGEFAFSMHETHEEWEAEQLEFAEFSEVTDAESAEDESAIELEPDPFGSVWSSIVSDDPLPGDSNGHMTLAFLLTEIVSELQMANASKDDIRRLNACFIAYRRDSVDRSVSGQELCDCLEDLARRHPQLTSRSSDFQSRIAELYRTAATSDD
jgi:hypothetical protein